MECSTGDTMTAKERDNLMKMVRTLENKLGNPIKCPGKNNKKPKKCTKWTVEVDRARRPRRRAVRAVEEREMVREEDGKQNTWRKSCKRC